MLVVSFMVMRPNFAYSSSFFSTMSSLCLAIDPSFAFAKVFFGGMDTKVLDKLIRKKDYLFPGESVKRERRVGRASSPRAQTNKSC